MRERLKRAAAFLLCAVILSGALPLSDALSLSGAVEAAGNRVGIVRGDALRVRSAPDTSDSSNIVGYLNTGDTVTILDETTVSGDDACLLALGVIACLSLSIHLPANQRTAP